MNDGDFEGSGEGTVNVPNIKMVLMVCSLSFSLFWAETDNPPVANAGEDAVVDLPVTTATLNGTASHDDKGIVHYKWTVKSVDSPTVDMEVRLYV